MGEIFTQILTRPLLNLLLWLYDVIPGQDIGIAIIVLTIIVKVLLYPLAKKQIAQQKALQDIQPKIAEIQKAYKDDREGQARELMALYQKEKVNPASSCLPILVQLPIFIALFSVLRSITDTQDFNLLYPFVAQPGQIVPMLFNFVHLDKPNIPLAILGGAVQFWQSKQMFARNASKQPPKDVQDKPGAQDEGMAAMMNKQMMYMMPIVTVVIGFSLPGALTLYWLVMSLLTVLQQWYMLEYKRKPVAPAVVVEPPQLPPPSQS